MQVSYVENRRVKLISDLFKKNTQNLRKPAIIRGRKIVSYDNLLNEIHALSVFLQEKYPKKSHVFIINSDKLELILGIYGTINSGHVAIPIHSKTTLANLINILKNYNSNIILTNQTFFESCLKNETGFFNKVQFTLMTDFQKSKYENKMDNLFNSRSIVPNKKEASHQTISPESTALILPTSGTTGMKKGVIVTHNNLIESTKYLNDFMQVPEDICEFITSPFTYSFGLSRTRAILLAGGTMVFENGKFSPLNVLDSIIKNNCNAISGVSYAFSMIIKNYERNFKKIGKKIRWIETGGMPMPLSHKEKLLEIFPAARIYMNYGLTEAMKSTIIEFRSERRKLESVGKPCPGVEIKITDFERRILPPEHMGLISIKGVNIAKGYLGMEDDWATKYQNGMLQTNDVGYLDDDGYLYVLGRRDDIINVGGRKFHPIEVENILEYLIKDTKFSIIGFPDPKMNLFEIPVICLEGKNSLSLNEIQQWLKNRIEPFKIPQMIFNLDKFPRTDNGKIRRGEIKEWIFTDSIRLQKS